MSFHLPADDESDTSPHDVEGGNVDLEYGTVLLNLQNHQSFTQMQVCTSAKQKLSIELCKAAIARNSFPFTQEN